MKSNSIRQSIIDKIRKELQRLQTRIPGFKMGNNRQFLRLPTDEPFHSFDRQQPFNIYSYNS